ncbi:MAG: endonuclease MutS2, partial [Myxococcota bacterium]
MDELRAKAARDLEWAALLEGIAAYAPGAPARDRIIALMPADDVEDAQRRQRRTAAALTALEGGAPLPSLGVPAVDEVLAHLRKGGVLTGEALLEVLRVLTKAAVLRAYAREAADAHPDLVNLLYVDPALESSREALDRCLDERGTLRDGASAALKQARGHVRAARKELLSVLSRLSQRYDDVLREQGYVERDGRYGLPVRSDAHRKVEGIVLGASATGATLYVEPPPVTAVSNRIRLGEEAVGREEARLFAELSATLRAQIDAVEAAYEACVEADYLSALCRYATAVRGRAIPLDDVPRIDLRRMRHPLLVGKTEAVVANDLRLEAGEAMVVSGPNAGGKTVALKCLGLAVWMTRCGLPVPAAAGSEVGWFDAVLTDIGDNQSIERSLSTFSAEVATLAAMLARADGRTLVLLDEVAGGTDPDEGAALAASVLEALVAQGAAVAATTHYERLKELAAEAG